METNEYRMWHAAGALLSLAAVSFLVFRVSDAAFTATTSNAGSELTAGSVTIGDDDAGSAMFTLPSMEGGDSATQCVRVTYTGSLDATVRLYGSLGAGSDGLEDYLDLDVYRGAGGQFGDCTGFVSAESVYTGTVAAFMASATSFANGLGTWAPTGGAPDDDMTYKFVITLQSNNAAQGKAAEPTFTWEAQS